MTETSLAFGAGGGLVGTLCLPDPGTAAADVGLVLFNAGVVHRVGPHRINVRLARRLARRGIPSIRFDLAGQGDSARPGGALPFESQAVADLRSAMDTLAERSGARRFALFGFCSGGVHSYAAAQVDDRIAGIILYDAYQYPTFKSRLNRFLRPLREDGLAAVAGRLAGRAVQRWRIWRGLEKEPPPPAWVGMFRKPPKEEFARVVRTLHERGTRVGVMTSGSLWSAYAGQFNDAFASLGVGRLVTEDFMPALEHNATRLAEQAEFMKRIEQWTLDLDTHLRAATKP